MEKRIYMSDKKIFIRSQPWRIDLLASKDNHISASPEYQRRAGVWSMEAKSYLIDTLISGLPLPPLYFAKDGFKFQIIDGLQRYTVINEFIQNQFSLKFTPKYEGTQYWDNEQKAYRRINLSDKRFRDLDPYLQNHIKLSFVDVIEIENANADQIRNIFNRLNNGVALTPYDKANGAYINLKLWQEIKKFREEAEHNLWDNNQKFQEAFDGESTADGSFWALIFLTVHSDPDSLTWNFFDKYNYADRLEEYACKYERLSSKFQIKENRCIEEVRLKFDEAFISFKSVYLQLKDQAAKRKSKILFDNPNHVMPLFLLFAFISINNIDIDTEVLLMELSNTYFEETSATFEDYKRANGNAAKQRKKRFEILLKSVGIQ